MGRIETKHFKREKDIFSPNFVQYLGDWKKVSGEIIWFLEKYTPLEIRREKYWPDQIHQLLRSSQRESQDFKQLWEYRQTISTNIWKFFFQIYYNKKINLFCTTLYMIVLCKGFVSLEKKCLVCRPTWIHAITIKWWRKNSITILH